MHPAQATSFLGPRAGIDKGQSGRFNVSPLEGAGPDDRLGCGLGVPAAAGRPAPGPRLGLTQFHQGGHWHRRVCRMGQDGT